MSIPARTKSSVKTPVRVPLSYNEVQRYIFRLGYSLNMFLISKSMVEFFYADVEADRRILYVVNNRLHMQALAIGIILSDRLILNTMTRSGSCSTYGEIVISWADEALMDDIFIDMKEGSPKLHRYKLGNNTLVLSTLENGHTVVKYALTMDGFRLRDSNTIHHMLSKILSLCPEDTKVKEAKKSFDAEEDIGSNIRWGPVQSSTGSPVQSSSTGSSTKVKYGHKRSLAQCNIAIPSYNYRCTDVI